MRLTIQDKGKLRHHGRTHGAGKPIDFTGDRFLFYDERGSTTYDNKNSVWYKDGVQTAPSFPLSLSLDDGRTVTVSQTGGGKLKWQVQ